MLNGRRVVLWRHGRTAWNAARRFQGHSDVPLDEVGRAQAAAAAPTLALMGPSMIISSDLERARHTAVTLGQLVDLPVRIDPRLRETHAGAWEGLDRPALERDFGEELAAWAAGSNLAPGGGERRSEVATRMLLAIDEALADVPAGGALVVATHGGSARAAIGSMLGLPTEHWGILGVLTNCAWCVLAETNGVANSLADLRTGPTERFPDVPPTPKWRLVEYNARTLPEDPVSDDR
ncbi:MAG: histidine phosphatase family protein [Candidatus Nanopelagicales bacterium]|nr:histidine phosphatase family protein [Candidatus Nanopelagicales bacterium]